MNRTFVAPLERIKLECIIQGSKYTWFRTIQSIWAREGPMGFWKGNVLNLFRMVPFKCINFISYDMYCARLLRVRGAKEITNHDRLIAGGISGITATILCLPLDTVSLLNAQSLSYHVMTWQINDLNHICWLLNWVWLHELRSGISLVVGSSQFYLDCED